MVCIFKIFFSFLYIFLNFTEAVFRNYLEEARKGDNVILIRHALAPGGGDPDGFNIKTVRLKEISMKLVLINQKKLEKYLETIKYP